VERLVSQTRSVDLDQNVAEGKNVQIHADQTPTLVAKVLCPIRKTVKHVRAENRQSRLIKTNAEVAV